MKSLRRRVVDAVLAGASTIREVLAVVGCTISAAQAATAGRRNSKRQGVTRAKLGYKPRPVPPRQRDVQGRRVLVNEALIRLVKAGELRRLGRGRYGPPLPKIHVPDPPAQAAG